MIDFRHLQSAAAAVLAGALLLPAVEVCAQPAGVDLSVGETRTALDAAIRRMTALEQRVKTLQQSNRSLGESLAAANAEASQYRGAYQEMRLQMEALGIEAIKTNDEGIEQRLLKAVRDNQLLEQENKGLTEQLMRLAEVALTFSNTVGGANPQGLKVLEQEIQAVERRLSHGESTGAESAKTIAGAEVVDVAPEHGLVVLNAGEASGVRVGMPLEVTRGDSMVGRGLVIDVRSGISGLMVQHLASDGNPVKVGDRVRLQTQQTTL